MHSAQSGSTSTAPPAWFTSLVQAFRALLRSARVRRRERSLRLCETLALGEKRFLAVIEFEERRFLIGATNQSISLIDRLDSTPPKRQKHEPSLEASSFHGVH
jgi:flagellar biogenesis protein FliO